MNKSFYFLTLYLLAPSLLQAGKLNFMKECNFEAKAVLIRPGDITLDQIVKLSRLVNKAYLDGEKEICVPNMKRTSKTEIMTLIEKQNLIGLKIGTEWKGCVQVDLSKYDETKNSGIFGMLAIEDEPEFRGKGFGSLLVDKAEAWARGQGYKT